MTRRESFRALFLLPFVAVVEPKRSERIVVDVGETVEIEFEGDYRVRHAG